MLFLSLSLLAASCSKNMYTAGMDKVQKSEFEAHFFLFSLPAT